MVDVKMGGVMVTCLVDTGSMVSTITETLFKEHFQLLGQDQLRSFGWLQLKAAYGLDIPYRDYLELDVEAMSGLVGINILQGCLQEMFRQDSPSLFTSPSMSSVPAVWKHALLACQSFGDLSGSGLLGRVSTPPGSSVHVPAGSLKLVSAVCRQGLCPLVPCAFLESGETRFDHS